MGNQPQQPTLFTFYGGKDYGIQLLQLKRQENRLQQHGHFWQQVLQRNGRQSERLSEHGSFWQQVLQRNGRKSEKLSGYRSFREQVQIRS